MLATTPPLSLSFYFILGGGIGKATTSIESNYNKGPKNIAQQFCAICIVGF